MCVALQYDAAKFLIHFMGDIHQPLHVGFLSNLGGNDITGTFLGNSTELHAVWDQGIISERLTDFSGNIDTYAAHLVSQLQGPWASNITTWTTAPTCMTPNDKSCVIAWATESANLACEYAYTDETGTI